MNMVWRCAGLLVMALGLMMLVNSCSGDRSGAVDGPGNGKPGESTSLSEFSLYFLMEHRAPVLAGGLVPGAPVAPGSVTNFDAKPQWSKDGSSLEVEMPVA